MHFRADEMDTGSSLAGSDSRLSVNLLRKVTLVSIKRDSQKRTAVVFPKNRKRLTQLGVHDLYRMGALRFKRVMDGPFLDNDDKLAAPPIARLRELEHATRQVEEKSDPDDPDYLKWLYMLIAPASSLGGARSKSCVIDEDNTLWIAHLMFSAPQ